VASAFTHAIAGLAVGSAFRRPEQSGRFWTLGAIGAALPDIDVAGFWLGVRYQGVFGHRGFTHSLFFAALYASLALFAFDRSRGPAERRRIWLYLFLAAASHGVLDAMTTGGGGVAFFAPFWNERYFLPWRPILVSPMNIRRFFTARGVAILGNEFVWVWLPAAMFAATATLVRRRIERKG
jgi:inner membrane protein